MARRATPFGCCVCTPRRPAPAPLADVAVLRGGTVRAREVCERVGPVLVGSTGTTLFSPVWSRWERRAPRAGFRPKLCGSSAGGGRTRMGWRTVPRHPRWGAGGGCESRRRRTPHVRFLLERRRRRGLQRPTPWRSHVPTPPSAVSTAERRGAGRDGWPGRCALRSRDGR